MMNVLPLIAREDYQRLESLYSDIRNDNGRLRDEVKNLNDVCDGWRDLHAKTEREYNQLRLEYESLTRKYNEFSQSNHALVSKLEGMVGIVANQGKHINLLDGLLKKQLEN